MYDRAFRDIVVGAAEGLNGAIMAYGQTASGKTYSISGSTWGRASSGLKGRAQSGNKGPDIRRGSRPKLGWNGSR